MKNVLLKLKYLSPKQRKELETEISNRRETLSVRAKNIAHELVSLDNILPFIYPEVKYDGLSKPHCGLKTHGEINSCLMNIRTICDSYIANINVDMPVPEYSHSEKLYTELAHTYSFLTNDDLTAIVNFEKEHGTLPLLYIVRQYMLSARQRSQTIIRNFFGINLEHVKYSLSELASRTKLTMERCRQITVSSFTLEHPELINYVKRVLPGIMKNVISPTDDIIIELMRDNMLEDESPEYIISLLGALVDTHIVLNIADDAEQNLVRPALLKNVKPRHTFNLIKREMNVVAHTEPYQLDVRPFITPDKDAEYHSDVYDLAIIYVRYITRKFGCTPLSDSAVTAPANRVDVVNCAAEILREKGKPMLITELWDELNVRFPNHNITNISYFKFKLCHSNIVRPKGKTGIYTLTEWSDQFIGTITDYIFEILSKSDTPLTHDELFEAVKQEFPTATRASILTLIYLDKRHEYVQFEDNMVGVQDKPYEGLTLKERPLSQRRSFDDNFKLLEEFISTNRRLPLMHADADSVEIQLYRWMSNVKYDNIMVTEEQHEAFNELMMQNITIPHNLKEFRFQQNCREILNIVRQTGNIPSLTDHRELRSWYNLQKIKYILYTDNRRQFFHDMLMEIKKLVTAVSEANLTAGSLSDKAAAALNENFYTPSLFNSDDKQQA